MNGKPLFRLLIPTYLIIVVVSVVLVTYIVYRELQTFHYTQAWADLETRTNLVRRSIEEKGVELSDKEYLSNAVRRMSTISESRLTILDADGYAVADSAYDLSDIDNQSDKPEIASALQGSVGRDKREDIDNDGMAVYVAVPVKELGKLKYIVRTSLPAHQFDSAPGKMISDIIAGTIIIGLLAGISSFIAAKRITSPLAQMRQSALKFAEGDFRSRMPVPDIEEYASLAITLNRMATQLGEQVRTITQKSGEQQAILSSMKEGVVAIDNDDRIMIMNPSAEVMLATTAENVQGKTIQEAIRNSELQRFFRRIRESKSPVTEEISIHGREKTISQLTGTQLVDDEGNQLGVLVVMNDITETRRLESVRKDFVANVSHELRTPITSIKGFVDTLVDGAIEDPKKSRDFLDIVARQADRLHAIIEDLLALSRIEEEDTHTGISMSESSICEVLGNAIVDCNLKADQANVRVTVDCSDDLYATINAPLMEQAVANLLDNAIKFSPNGSVVLRAEKHSGLLSISITDTGCGIEPDHIPRLFERFYRVDKARSRKMGGTGLGLAIVKHIVQAHRGRIDIESVPGMGSTFTMQIPVDSRHAPLEQEV